MQRRPRKPPNRRFRVRGPESRIHRRAPGLAHLFCLATLFLIFNSPIRPALSQDEYSFELSEIEKRPYSLGGYIELRPVVFGLDKDAGLYRLKFYNRDEGKRIEEYNFKLQLDGSFERGIAKFNIRTNSDISKSYLGWSNKTSIYEGYLALKPSSNLTIDVGKKTSKWGKGYAWNPVAFVDRPKDPDDPELSLEGYIMASADYIKSFDGPLKTLSLTPVIFPVYKDVNEGFGESNQLNLAGKIYLLLYDTDIDFLFLTGGSKNRRYGMDFSRNITTNFEIHGEFALINDFKKISIDRNRQVIETEYDAKNYLLGLRYLTAWDTTVICEYYHNDMGFSREEMRGFFSFIEQGYDLYLSSGSNELLKNALNLTWGPYGRRNPMRDYLYLRVSQKEPFDILYFTPSVTCIYNMNDNSFSLNQEMIYSPMTNLELRSKISFLGGGSYSEYGEKQNDYRLELRIRYYF